MGFPSPAADYVEARLTADYLCEMDANCTVIETSEGYAVINRSLTPKNGKRVLMEHIGRISFAEVRAGTLVTEDGVIRGDELDEVKVLGVLTYLITRTHTDDDIPV